MPNGALPPDEIERLCAPDAETRILLREAFRRFGMSARSFRRVLKVARTVADLAGVGTVGADHVLEALQCRLMDRDAV